MNALESIRQFYLFSERSCIGIDRIQGDASNRQYFRVTEPSGTTIACIDPLFRAADPQRYPFITIRNLLAENGVRVPDLLGEDHHSGLLLIEDCGDLMLQNEATSLDAAGITLRYRQIIDILIRIQSIRPNGKTSNTQPPFSLGFDHDKLMFEFDFFIEHALKGFFGGLFDDRQILRLQHEFSDIADLLVRPEHFVLNHRDFHSRNIMLFRNEPVIIDFQDARLGLPQYDAVSLLRDSYVRLDPLLVEELKRYHFELLRNEELTSMTEEEYLRFFDLMAFQRNIKAVGTFCYQTTVIGNHSFEPCIAPTLAYLTPYIEARPELTKAGRLLEPLLFRKSR
ncbi:MAG: phosphotransferase [Chlorobiaceae bacterium]|jgi:N-acetylmuramate 1-kinase|nr:phosphotransferase [Chlorobiaceae bacterium]